MSLISKLESTLDNLPERTKHELNSNYELNSGMRLFTMYLVRLTCHLIISTVGVYN